MKRPPEIIGLRTVNEETIYPHIFPNADREVGGVLVGRTPADQGLPMITGAIEALSADEQVATLTFTQDAWEHVHKVLAQNFAEDDRIVGWYHSHPGFGIFLSEHDLFIHRNFFSAPSQIAVVVDPHGKTEGAFVWKDGEIEMLFEKPTPSSWEVAVPRPINIRREVPAVEMAGARSNQHSSDLIASLVNRFSKASLLVRVAIPLLAGAVIALGAVEIAGCGNSSSTSSSKTTTHTTKQLPAR